jgi:GNAT superfamily N-acetyltransferase
MDHDLLLPPYDDDVIAMIVQLSAQVFGEADANHIRWRLTRTPDTSIFTVSQSGEPVAFKAGYAVSATKYYSWLGGVRPDHRRRGIASDLMVRQHRWLIARGYLLVETATNQENHVMATVNLQHGFSVCGMRTYSQAVQILFMKSLEPDLGGETRTQRCS